MIRGSKDFFHGAMWMKSYFKDLEGHNMHRQQ
jgi:hypothetical protein